MQEDAAHFNKFNARDSILISPDTHTPVLDTDTAEL